MWSHAVGTIEIHIRRTGRQDQLNGIPVMSPKETYERMKQRSRVSMTALMQQPRRRL